MEELNRHIFIATSWKREQFYVLFEEYITFCYVTLGLMVAFHLKPQSHCGSFHVTGLVVLNTFLEVVSW